MTDMTTFSLHGRKVCFVRSGHGPTVVLVHGMAGRASAWAQVTERLTAHADAVVVDLPGHGDSARLRGDHSIGAFATWLRDVLESVEVEHATFVGHSLGGGVVMQFAYQFPQYVERMVLVSSGGLGREVSAVLRAAALPGSELVIAGLGAAAQRMQPLLGPVLRTGDRQEVLHSLARLADADRRAAFVRAVRAVMSLAGQRVSAADRLYLAAEIPTLIVWGERDRIIPVSHAYSTHEAMPGSRLVVLERSGHFPYVDEPERFAALVTDFMRETPAAVYDAARIRARLRAGDAIQAADPVGQSSSA